MAARRKRYEEEEEHANHERWLVTYADMLTVLMALFIVMFAISTVDKTKAEKLAGSVREYFGTGPTLVDGGDGLLEDQKPGNAEEQLAIDIQAAVAALDEKKAREKAVATENDELAEVERKITESLVEKGLEKSVRFRIDERGLVVTVVTDDVLFDLGSADLRPAGRTVLDGIGPALVPLPNPVTVEGHTDDLPIVGGGRYATNWELSTERATSVLRYLIDAHRLPTQRMSAAGYADTRPIAENVPATRGANRRVVVIVKATAQDAPVPPHAPARPAGAPAPAPPAAPAPAPATAAGPIQEQD